MKRLIAILLCTLLLCSCGAGADTSFTESETASQAVSQETSEYVMGADPLAVLPDADFGEQDIVIWTTDPALVIPGEAYDTSLQKILQERIDAIENKFNTNIVIEVKTSAELTDGLKYDRVLPDLVIMSSNQSAMNSISGLYSNLWSLPYFTEAQKSLGGLAQEQTINNSLFMLTGPFMYAPQNALALYVNRDMLVEAGMRFPSYAVEDGTWTDEKMKEYMLAVSTSVGKDSPDTERDIFGVTTLGMDTKTLINAFWNASGIDYFGETMGKPLRAEFDYIAGEQATDFAEYITESGVLLKDGNDSARKNAFMEGRSLFCLTYFNTFTGENRITEFDWEVVPLPKVYEGQKDYSSPLTEAMCISVPAKCGDSYRAGLIVSAFILSSYEIKQTLEDYYIAHTSPDNENTVMMQRIFASTHYTKTELYSAIYNIASVGKNLIATSVTDGIDLGTYIRWQDPQMEQTAEKFK